MCLWPGCNLYHDTAKRGYSGVVKESTGEWNGALLSSVMRVGSVCMYASDGRTRVWRRPGEHHLPECIRQQHTGPISGFMLWGNISFNSWSHLVFLQDEVNSFCYIEQVVNLVFCHFFDRKFLFHQDDACAHTSALRQHLLHGVQQLPWLARSPNLSPIQQTWDMVKQEPILFPETVTTIAELRQRV